MVFNRFCFLHLLQLKKLTAISLLILLIFQSSGVVMVLDWLQQIVQHEMWNPSKQEASHLQKMTLSVAVFESSKINPHEIKIDGLLYDLHSVKQHGNVVEVWAVNDVKEESILSYIKKLTENPTKSDNKNSHHILKLLTAIYLPVQLNFQCKLKLMPEKQYCLFFESILTASKEIWLPPPRLA